MYTDEMIMKKENEALANGEYNPQTTFYTDFMIANMFGRKAIEDTFKRAFKEWKDDIVYLTELAMVTNRYSWEMSSMHRPEISDLYAGYYYKCYDYVYGDPKTFTKAERDYFFHCTD